MLPVKPAKAKLVPMKIEQQKMVITKAQHAEQVEGPQFIKLKLKKPSLKPKQESVSVTLPKFQLKSRIKYISDWPPNVNTPIVSFLGSVRQSGILSRNVKEAAKIVKKPIKLNLPDHEAPVLEKPEVFEFDNKKDVPIISDEQELLTSEMPIKTTDLDHETDTKDRSLSPADADKNIPKRPKTEEDIVDNLQTKTKSIKSDLKPKKKNILKSPKSAQDKIELDKTMSDDEKPAKENDDQLEVTDKIPKIIDESKPNKMKKLKLTPIKIERKTVELSTAQHAESFEGPQFTKLKLKKTVTKQKEDLTQVALPKFQLKSRIRFITDWPPLISKPAVSFLGSVRQNGILSRNVKEAAKIKKKQYKEPILSEIEKVELETPLFGHDDIVLSLKESSEVGKQNQESIVQNEDEDLPGQFTVKPRRPSVKVTEEIVDEVTLKKKLKPVRKSSVTLPEITEPENVTFRPKSTKTKEDVEQEFNIQLDSYAEEEISMSSKVKLKPHRQPTFNEEADETSIKFYEETEGPDVVEVIESDIEEGEETENVMLSLNKKPKKISKTKQKEITSNVTVSKPKSIQAPSEISEDVSFKLQPKSEYHIDDQEKVSFDVKSQIDQFTTEELSLSSKIKLKAKRKVLFGEAADETSIQIRQEIEDDSQAQEIFLSEDESEDKVEMVIKRKPKKPTYEVSEIEELSVELKPKRINENAYEEEHITILSKRKPKKPSLQGNLQYHNY